MRSYLLGLATVVVLLIGGGFALIWFGYFPMATHLVIEAADVSKRGLRDAVARAVDAVGRGEIGEIGAALFS